MEPIRFKISGARGKKRIPPRDGREGRGARYNDIRMHVLSVYLVTLHASHVMANLFRELFGVHIERLTTHLTTEPA